MLGDQALRKDFLSRSKKGPPEENPGNLRDYAIGVLLCGPSYSSGDNLLLHSEYPPFLYRPTE